MVCKREVYINSADHKSLEFGWIDPSDNKLGKKPITISILKTSKQPSVYNYNQMLTNLRQNFQRNVNSNSLVNNFGDL